MLVEISDQSWSIFTAGQIICKSRSRTLKFCQNMLGKLAMRSMVSRVSKPVLLGRHFGSKPPTTKPLSMVNWNIDGLNEKYLTTRTAHIMRVLKKIKPSVIFLQEVREDKLEIFNGLRSHYQVIEKSQSLYLENPRSRSAIPTPKKPGMEYFTCVLLRKDTISVDKTVDHSMYIRIVSSLFLFFAFLNWSKQIY